MKKNLVLLSLMFSLPILAQEPFVVSINPRIVAYKEAVEGGEKRIINDAFGLAFKQIGIERGFYRLKHQKFEFPLFLPIDSDVIMSSERDSDFLMAKKAKTSNIFRKALVINNLGVNPNPDLEIDFFDNPDLEGTPVGKITIFEVRFIFQQRVNKTGKDVVLLGKSDRFKYRSSRSSLIGWMDYSYVKEWLTREGVEFDKSTYSRRTDGECRGLGRVYSQIRDLRRGSNPIASESESAQEMKYYANRYPVLDFDETNNAHALVFIGGALSQGKLSSDLSAEVIDQSKSKLMEVINRGSVEIAVLIDATKGMGPHLGNVKGALTRFLGGYEDETSRPKIAIAAYRDYVDGPGLFEVASDFSSDIVGLTSALNRIKAYSSTNDKGEFAFPEALFHGVHQALSKLSWSTEIGEKFILVIGDHGNHPNDPRNYTADKLGKALSSRSTTLHAIQVHFDPSLENYNRLFKEQFFSIKQSNANLGGELKRAGSSSEREIFSALEEILSWEQGVKKDFVSIRLGKMYPGVFHTKLLKRYGIDPRVFGSKQVTHVGYIHKSDPCSGLALTKESVLMKKIEVEALKVQMQQLSDALYYYERDAEDDFKRTVFKVVKAITNDKMEAGENISTFIQKRSGIPIKTPFLDQTLDELLDAIRQEHQRVEYRRYLQEKLIGLEEVSRESILDWDRNSWDEEEQTFSWHDSRKQRRFFYDLELPLEHRFDKHMQSLDSRRTYGWIPIEFIP